MRIKKFLADSVALASMVLCGSITVFILLHGSITLHEPQQYILYMELVIFMIGSILYLDRMKKHEIEIKEEIQQNEIRQD